MLRTIFSALNDVSENSPEIKNLSTYSSSYRYKINYTSIQSKKRDVLLVFWGGVNRQKKKLLIYG